MFCHKNHSAESQPKKAMTLVAQCQQWVCCEGKPKITRLSYSAASWQVNVALLYEKSMFRVKADIRSVHSRTQHSTPLPENIPITFEVVSIVSIQPFAKDRQ